MPIVHIPSQMQDLTGGSAEVVVQGQTIRQVIDQLETRLTSSEGKLASLIGKLPGDLLNDDTEESSQ